MMAAKPENLIHTQPCTSCKTVSSAELLRSEIRSAHVYRSGALRVSSAVYSVDSLINTGGWLLLLPMSSEHKEA